MLEKRGAAGNAAVQLMVSRAKEEATLHRDETEEASAPDPALLSGSHWHDKATEMGWDFSTSLDDLEEPFKTNAETFIEALRNGGATVEISTTKRSIERAWLMHNAWTVATGGAIPKSDPYGTGIIWDHGTRAASKEAAKEMISPAGFGMAYDASMHSKHFSGHAIDITITNLPEQWTFTHGDKQVTVKLGAAGAPDNTRLHRAADTYFNVKKLVGDRPHWSDDGH
jgi:hypothetical protein